MRLRVCRLLPLAVLIILAACDQKNADKRKWFKGNLHTHSFWSDGDEYPEMIIDWYKSNGYDFVALSDHNTLAAGEKWITVPKSRMYEEGFEKYMERFGESWIEFKMDTGRTHVKLKTYQEYKTLFEDEGFLIIQSEEITDRFEGKPIHINATNVVDLIPAQGGSSVADLMQRNVDAVLRQREQSGVPMFPHINHPNFYYAIDVEDMIALRGERFFEVYNGHPLVHNYGDSLRPGTETMWDLINMAYRKRDQSLLMGLATDDSHNYHQFGTAYSNAGRGWVMVHADSLDPADLIRAMEDGDFYASTGVSLERYDFVDNEIRIKVSQEEGVDYEIQFIGVARNETRARVMDTVKGATASFKITADHLFVRAKIVSSRLKTNPFQEKDMETAWTQPEIYTE